MVDDSWIDEMPNSRGGDSTSPSFLFRTKSCFYYSLRKGVIEHDYINNIIGISDITGARDVGNYIRQPGIGNIDSPDCD